MNIKRLFKKMAKRVKITAPIIQKARQQSTTGQAFSRPETPKIQMSASEKAWENFKKGNVLQQDLTKNKPSPSQNQTTAIIQARLAAKGVMDRLNEKKQAGINKSPTGQNKVEPNKKVNESKGATIFFDAKQYIPTSEQKKEVKDILKEKDLTKRQALIESATKNNKEKKEKDLEARKKSGNLSIVEQITESRKPIIAKQEARKKERNQKWAEQKYENAKTLMNSPFLYGADQGMRKVLVAGDEDAKLSEIERQYGVKIPENVKAKSAKTKENTGYKVGEFGGALFGNTVHGAATLPLGGAIGWGKAGASALKAGKPAKEVLKGIGKDRLSDAILSTPMNVLDSAAHSENKKEFAKNFGINTAFDVGLGGVLGIPEVRKIARGRNVPKGVNPAKREALPDKGRKQVLKAIKDFDSVQGAKKPQVAQSIDNVNKTAVNEAQDLTRAYNAPTTTEPKETSIIPEPVKDVSLNNGDTRESLNVRTEKFVKKTNPNRIVQSLKESFVDIFEPMEKYYRDMRRAGDWTGGTEGLGKVNAVRQADESAKYNIFEKQTDRRGNVVGESIRDVFQPIIKKGDNYYLDFQDYGYHLHNIDRAKQGKAVFVDNDGNMIGADVSKARVAMYEKMHPEFPQHFQKVRRYLQNEQQLRVDAGIRSQESVDIMDEMYQNYLPTHRVGGKVGGGFRAKGSGEDIIPLHEQMASQTMYTRREVEVNALLKDLAEKQGVNVDSAGGYSDLTFMEKTKDKHIFRFFDNGQLVEYETTPDMYRVMENFMKNGSLDNEAADAFVKGMNKYVMQPFKELITSYNPFFMARNFARDTQDALMYTKNPVGFLKAMPKATKEMMTDGEYHQSLLASGIRKSSFFDINRSMKSGAWSKWNPLRRIEQLNQAVEMLPRMTEYVAVMDDMLKGAPLSSATKEMKDVGSLAAADITVNFGRSGKLGKALNSGLTPFFNPAVQGFDKVYRVFTGQQGARGYLGLALKATAIGIAPNVINELVYGDDEQFKMLHDRDRNTNFLFKVGDTEFLKIPQGRVISVLGMPFRGTIRQAKGEDVDWLEIIKTSRDQIGPVSPWESNLFSPIKGAMNNETWYGSPIEDSGDESLPKGERWDESTTTISKAIGGKLGISPKKIDYVVDSYTGIIGDTAMPLLTPQAEQNFAKKQFVIDSTLQNNLQTKFYKRKEEVTQQAKSKDATYEDGFTNKYYNSIGTATGDNRKKIQEIQMSDLSNKEKLAKIRTIREENNELLQNAQKSEKVFNDAIKEQKDHYKTKLADKPPKTQDTKLFQGAMIRVAKSEKKDPWALVEKYNSNSENRLSYIPQAKEAGFDPEDFNLFFALNKDLDGSTQNGTPTKKELFDFINNTEYTAAQKAILWGASDKRYAKNNPFLGGTVARSGKRGRKKGSGRSGRRGGSRSAKVFVPPKTESEKAFTALQNASLRKLMAKVNNSSMGGMSKSQRLALFKAMMKEYKV